MKLIIISLLIIFVAGALISAISLCKISSIYSRREEQHELEQYLKYANKRDD